MSSNNTIHNLGFRVEKYGSKAEVNKDYVDVFAEETAEDTVGERYN